MKSWGCVCINSVTITMPTICNKEKISRVTKAWLLKGGIFVDKDKIISSNLKKAGWHAYLKFDFCIRVIEML